MDGRFTWTIIPHLMKREELLRLIERAGRIEEGTVENLTEYISAAIRWTGLTEKENARILQGLKKLHEGSTVHALLLRELRGWLRTQDGDAF